MAVQQSEFTRGYNSFSGIDIKATFGTKVIGTLQGISYSISREKAPIYTMGSADPRAFARGKRGIAGSLVFIQFDEDPLMWELANRAPGEEARRLYFLSDVDDLRPEYSQEIVVGETSVAADPEGINVPGATAQQQESEITSAGSDQKPAIPWYADQIPPFDIVLAAANEYGALAIMKILGVELMNSGYGVSVDDIVSEHSFTYIAHGMLPWQSQGQHVAMQGINPS
jgi:hypothetical protein